MYGCVPSLRLNEWRSYIVRGPVRSESPPGESIVSRGVGNGIMQKTSNREALFVRGETPATTA